MFNQEGPDERSITLQRQPHPQDLVDTLPSESDMPQRIKRSARIVVLCCALGALTGYVTLLQQPPTFRSAAKIQVIDKSSYQEKEAVEASLDHGTSLPNEVLVIRSERILQEAARIGNLAQTPPFQGQTEEAIGSALNQDEALVVSLGDVDGPSNVVRVRFDASDPTVTKQVVESIVASYTEYTDDRFTKVDNKAVGEILAARDAAAKQLEELEQEYDLFKQKSQLLFLDGKTKSTHRSTADRLLIQREELLVGKTAIQSKLNAAEASLKRGDSPTTVLMALRGETETASDVIDRGISDRLHKIRDNSEIKPSARLHETQLLPLQLERNDLLENFGASHPTIVSLDKKIAVVQSRIERMKVAEEEKDSMIAKAMSLRGDTDDLDPEAEARKRVELALDALQQRLDSTQQQIASISEAYAEESEAAKQEIVAQRESQRLERELTRQTELYDRVLSRLDDVQLAGDQGLTIVTLDKAGLGLPVDRPLAEWTAWGSLIGALSGCLLVLFLPGRKEPDVRLNREGSQLVIPIISDDKARPAIANAEEIESIKLVEKTTSGHS